MAAKQSTVSLGSLSVQDLLTHLSRQASLEEALAKRLARIQEEVDALRALVGGTAAPAPKRGRPAKKAGAKRGRPAKKVSAKRGRPAKKVAAPVPAQTAGRPAKLRKGKPVLADAIRSVIQPGEAVKASEIIARLKKAGLASDAKNFTTMVLQTLSKHKNVFHRVRRGIYRVKA